MELSICVIAKDEETCIGSLIEQISHQTIFESISTAEILVICNGCTDRTVEFARRTFSNIRWPEIVTARVHDVSEAGKARSWNLAVHNIISETSEIAIFLDADIELASESVLADLINELEGNEDAVAITGWPLKAISRKNRKSILDRFSLTISSQTQYPNSINGSLYAAKLPSLRKIWLPVPIPGEDGMLSAMIKTGGFTHPPQQNLICRARTATHFYEAHTIFGFFRHEQRMVIGTMINGWIFERFWEGQHTGHVGGTVRRLNETKPNWVNELVAENVKGRQWTIPARLLTWRLDNLRNVRLKTAILRAPFSVSATILNIWPCVQANRRLKEMAVANYW